MYYVQGLHMMLEPESVKPKGLRFLAILCVCTASKDFLSYYYPKMKNGGDLKFSATLCECTKWNDSFLCYDFKIENRGVLKSSPVLYACTKWNDSL